MGRITVIGSGNGGLTAAYHFSRNGHRVCLYDFPEFETQTSAVRKAGGIRALEEEHGCRMILDGFAEVEMATNDIAEAMNFSKVYVMVCPSFAQELFFKDMIPYLKDGSVVIIMPANYGGLVFRKMLDDAGMTNIGVTFVDAVSIPWACRISEAGITSIMGIKRCLPVSIYPRDDGRALSIVQDILPVPVEILDSPIVAGLENINFGGHPLLTTLNMGLLENFGGKFNYYKDCCSTATARAAARMDIERLEVGKHLGINLRTELESMNFLYGTDEKSVYDFNRKSVTHGKINSAPDSSRSRYISEDVPYLLVPCYELAVLCGVDVPIIRSCITIASAYNDEDYFGTGRTLEKMGFGGWDLGRLKGFLKE